MKKFLLKKKKKNIPIKIVPIKYPLLKKNEENKKYNIVYDYGKNGLDWNEYYEKFKEVEKSFGEEKVIFSEEEAFLLEIINRRTNWIKNLSKEFSGKKEPFYDRLLLDLILKLIEVKKEGSIKNYDDFFNHPFFNQYNY